ncbi:MAG: DUF6145 family protein [Lachnospiraceae bacterium]|jgi:hypothetical protein|nr:DUF6145 family protein [Lachnospiraceae bacterium]
MTTNNREHIILCGASAYDMKYYFNEDFGDLPIAVREELRILCVLFTEETGGVFLIGFDEEGSVLLKTEHEESDIYYDTISSGLMIQEIRGKKKDLFTSLELYYRVFMEEGYHDTGN